MIGFPIAKINLGLRIKAKRSDGYHDLETIFYPVQFCDALEFVISENQVNNDILVTTGKEIDTDPENNLVIKAVRILRKKHSFPKLKIHLHKAIPLGAGLGGGSSDAVCILKGVNKSFGLNISEEELKEMSLELGSDCPFFIEGLPALGSGRGEILVGINPVLKSYYLVLINPGVGINTREAYENCSPSAASASLMTLADRPINEWKKLIINDFEEYAFKTHSFIGEIKNELYRSGAVFSLMSGSGSTVYGIFNSKPELPGQLRARVIFEGFL